MVLWHMGIAMLLVYATLGRSRIDYRFILLGAVAPDLADAIAGVAVDHGPAGRGVGHSIVAVIVVAVLVLVTTRAERRLSWFGLPVGWLLHLVADGMWMAPLTFLWPAFGTSFSDIPVEPYSWDVVASPADHAWTWMGEIAGLAILVWFWIAFLGTPERRQRFMHDGRLRA